jgi:hypothetical protein
MSVVYIAAWDMKLSAARNDKIILSYFSSFDWNLYLNLNAIKLESN